MASIKVIETAKEKITAYIRKINTLESDLEAARKETAKEKKSHADCKKELDTLEKKMKDIVQENENFQEAIKQFKLLGEKDKKEMDKMSGKIEELEKELDTLKESKS